MAHLEWSHYSKTSTLNKRVVYTVVIDNYDLILPPVITDLNVDYVVFTDNKKFNVKGWSVIFIEDSILSKLGPTGTNRYYKFFPNKFLKAYDTSIYIDGNIRIIGSLSFFFDDLDLSNKDIGLFKHSIRNNVNEEVQACIKAGKVNSSTKIISELQNYIKEGFNDDLGLTENGVIIRKHNNLKIISAMSLWWEYYLKSAGRDQISLPFVRYKLKLNENIYDINLWEENKFFKIYNHNKSNFKSRFISRLEAKKYDSIFHFKFLWFLRRLQIVKSLIKKQFKYFVKKE